MYLWGSTNNQPALCPAGWVQIGYNYEYFESGGVAQYVRTCFIANGHQPIYLHGNMNSQPPNCPAGWVQVDYKYTNVGFTGNYTRTCY